MPPAATNHCTSARVSAPRSVTGLPSGWPSGRRIRRPSAARSTRMSAEAPFSTGRGPVSRAKPNLPGRRGIFASAAVRVWARVSVAWVGGLVRKGVTIRLRSVSVSMSGSIRPWVPRSSIRGPWLAPLTPRNCRLARAERSRVPLPWIWAARAMAAACAGVRRPRGGRMRTTSPSPDCMGRRAPGHQPLISGATVMRRAPGCGRLSK